MEALDKIKNLIENLEAKDFYKYLTATLFFILLIVGLLTFNFYRKINNLNEQVELINEQREKAQRILTKAEQVKRQKNAVDALITKDKDFKIVGYFDKVLKKLNLKSDTIDVSPTEHVDYIERILKAKFAEVNMKQLCDLLNELEENKRIYTKELEIVKGKKPKTIDVNLIIATLELKEKQTRK